MWQRVTLPDDKALIPGVIDTNTNRVEHPELVAQRIERFAGLVGKERVIAGTDCGFETVLGMGACAPSAAWLKLGSLVEGARIASERLWLPRPAARAARPRPWPAARRGPGAVGWSSGGLLICRRWPRPGNLCAWHAATTG